jgi:hypothetical protein
MGVNLRMKNHLGNAQRAGYSLVIRGR